MDEFLLRQIYSLKQVDVYSQIVLISSSRSILKLKQYSFPNIFLLQHQAICLQLTTHFYIFLHRLQLWLYHPLRIKICHYLKQCQMHFLSLLLFAKYDEICQNKQFMGGHCCSSSASVLNVRNIPDPTGEPVDPLEAKGDMIQAINWDPHINYFKNQIEGVMMGSAKQNKKIRSKEQLQFATTDKKQYESYIEIVNNSIKGNQISTTNVLSYLFKEVADIREQEEVQAKFKDEKYSALKCFVYLYTGNYAYKKVNQSLRSNQYERLAPIIALVKRELSMFSKENSSLAQRNIGMLFRSIDIPDPLMVEKAKMYWKGFTSTALSKQVTKQFGRYQYTIILKRGLPHQYLIIPKELSRFEEEEVLIFPYFYFEVMKAQTFKANKTGNYDIVQMAPEILKEEGEQNQITSENAEETKTVKK